MLSDAGLSTRGEEAYREAIRCVSQCTLYAWVFESHPRQLIFLLKSDCLGCAVSLCFVVYMTLLASFFLHSASLTYTWCFIKIVSSVQIFFSLYLCFRLYPEYDQALNNLGNLLKVTGTYMYNYIIYIHVPLPLFFTVGVWQAC